MFEVRVGRQVWFEGEVWSVAEVEGAGFTLQAGRRFRRVSASALFDRASPIGGGGEGAVVDEDEVPVAALLSSLTSSQREEVEVRAARVHGIVLAVEGGATLADAVSELADELGTSTKTVRRWVSAYRSEGMAGLIDKRLRRERSGRIDVRWEQACRVVLSRYTRSSTPTMGAVLAAVEAEVLGQYGPGVVVVPQRTAAYSHLRAISKGTYGFGSAKARRSVANRPSGAYGRLRASRPGEYVLLDTTPLDVFAMEPVTLRWLPVELTVAMDLYTRCILGMRLTPVSTRSRDVANVLYQCVTPQGPSSSDDKNEWPFHGVPLNVVVPAEEDEADGAQPGRAFPGAVPESIVVDHGKQYLSAHVISACARLGISIQPAIPRKPTDKAPVERFFRTLREGLLQHLPGYKGPDVYSRGERVENDAFYYIAELEGIIREWVGTVYHRTRHGGLVAPEFPEERFSPAEMFEIGMTRCGCLVLPTRRELAYEFLEVHWRTIQHYGVEVLGRRYDGNALNLYRNRRSPLGGVNAGKWPIYVDSHDVRYAFFRDPTTREWSRLDWEHAPALEQPFSHEAAEYAKAISVREQRHVDPGKAVQELIAGWSRGEVESRRDRNLARRLSAARPAPIPDAGDDPPNAVVDLGERRQRRPAEVELVDDIDVFEKYYADRPTGQGLEVLE